MPHQDRFAFTGARNAFMAGGWGSAKTTAGLLWIAASMGANPGLPGIICQPTYSLLKEFVEFDFEPAFKPYLRKIVNGGREIYMRDGTKIVGVSYDRLDLLEKHNVAWLYGDEAAIAKPMFFTKATARVRHPKAGRLRIGLTGTPHYGWMQDEFDGRRDKDRAIYHASTVDNIHLSPEYIRNLFANCPARLRDAYIHGRFVAPGGTVYPEYDEDVHIIDWPYNPALPTFPSIDWSPRTPHVSIFQLIPEGMVIDGVEMRKLHGSHRYAAMVQVDELVPDGTHVAWTTERLMEEVRMRGWQFDHFIADPAGGAVQETSGLDSIRIAKEMLGIPWQHRTDSAARLVANGVDHVRNMLEPLDGIPRFYISAEVADRAKTLGQHLRRRASVNAIQGYSYPAEKDGAMVSVPIKDGITDHYCDTLRYAVVYHFPARRLLAKVVN